MMTPAQWFDVAGPIAMIGWICLIVSLFVPKASSWLARLRLLGGRVLPLVLCLGYAVALVAYFGTSPGGSFSSLQGVATLFSSQGVLLAGWVHYLAFDLFIGRWIVDDSAPFDINRFALVICLLLTFMLGPVGLLLYFGLRWLNRAGVANA